MTTAIALRDPALDAATPAISQTSLPYLVYGTLRSGERNNALLRGRAVFGALTRLHGLAMYNSGGRFPFAVEGSQDDSIIVQVARPHPATAAGLQRDLDRLEGFTPGHIGGLYERRAVRFFDREEGMLRWGWLYVCTDLRRVHGLPRISSGDWVSR